MYSTWEILHQIHRGELTELDAINFIDRQTGFNIAALKALKEDVVRFIGWVDDNGRGDTSLFIKPFSKAIDQAISQRERLRVRKSDVVLKFDHTRLSTAPERGRPVRLTGESWTKTKDFFEAVYKGQVCGLDMRNFVQRATDNFDPEKIEVLCEDFDLFQIEKLQEETEPQVSLLLKKKKGEITDEEYNIAVKKASRPILSIFDFFSDPSKLEQKREKVAEYSGWMYKNNNFIVRPGWSNLYELRNFLISLRKNNPGSDRKKMNPANKRKKSNSEKVSIANSWLPKLVRDISKIEDPTHEKVLLKIQEEFPDFEMLPDDPELSLATGTGEINKTSVDKALTFLFNKKHPVRIKEGTIKKRGDKLNWWENGK